MKFLAAILAAALLAGCAQTHDRPRPHHRRLATAMAPTTTTSTLPPAPTTVSPPTDPPVETPQSPPPEPVQAQPEPQVHVDSDVLACIRGHESANYVDPWAVNTGNGYYGAYQWLPSSWDSAAASVGRGDLVGRLPVEPAVSAADQDAVTLAYHNQVGDGPWGNMC